jgi:ATP-binding cassette, subfamily C (CFTR/MRP), member 1
VVLTNVCFTVDAHVAKALLEGAIIQNLRNTGKSVLLVTHALHFLPQCDYIYALSNTGKIGEHGTYANLLALDEEFARLDREFGGNSMPEKQDEEIEEIKPTNAISTNEVYDAVKAKSTRAAAMGSGKLEGRLTIKEKRTTGSVSWKGVLFSFQLLKSKTSDE